MRVTSSTQIVTARIWAIIDLRQGCAMDVEREYRARVAAMSVVERIGRAEALFKWSRDYLVRSILEDRGSLSKEALGRELAFRQYGSDPATRRWLEELPTHAER